MKVTIGNWQCKGYWANELSMVKDSEYHMLRGVTGWMQATVPGAVQQDLLDNGYIPDRGSTETASSANGWKTVGGCIEPSLRRRQTWRAM